MIVGLSAYAGHGKDQSCIYLMQAFADKGYRSERYALADPLKVCVNKFMGWGRREAFGDRKEVVVTVTTSYRKIQTALNIHINPFLKEVMATAEDYVDCLLKAGIKVVEVKKERTVELEITASPRQHYQIFGTDFIRVRYSDSFWFDLAGRYAKDSGVDFLILPDIRFPNEAAWVEDHGVVIGVHRANFQNEVGVNHSSEKHIPFILNKAERTIINSGDLAYLKERCKEVAEWLIGLRDT